ncbi:hypothetical protein [Nocardia terpenica]|uniref:hypothetical protein n=1 Tax=Nocardia terpenica TaxID=455432 RepID=UPI001EE9D087|nr:hypothetical protein [Nocardia terpenica]
MPNTSQNLSGAVVAPALGAVVAAAGFPTAVVLATGIAAAAIPLVPTDRTAAPAAR